MYSVDIINLFIASRIEGKTLSAIAKNLKITRQTLGKWNILYSNEINEKKYISDKKQNPIPHGSSKIHLYESKILEFVDKNTGCILNEIRTHIDKKLSNTTIYRILKQHGIKRKKITRKIAASSAQVINAKRTNFANTVDIADFQNWISIDEVGFEVGDLRSKGYAKKGIKIDHGIMKHKKVKERISVISAIAYTHRVGHKLVTGSVNGEVYVDFLKSLNLKRGTHIIHDNAPIHIYLGVKQYASDAGLILHYNAPYSPQFNPIELLFAEEKKIFRELPHDDMKKAIETTIKSTNPSYLPNYFNHALKHIKSYQTPLKAPLKKLIFIKKNSV